MSEVSHSPIRVLVVDQDKVSRTLLQRELGAAGYEVDVLSSGNGFTPDMVQLVQPDVLLIDPFMSDLPLAAVEEVLRGLRQDQQLVLLLIDDGRDPEGLKKIAEACRADGRIQKKELLAAPASTVGDQLIPETTMEAELIDIEEDLPTAQMAHEMGEEIILEEEPRPPRAISAAGVVRHGPAAVAPAAKAPRHVPTRPDLLSMIAEELEERPIQEPPPVRTVQVEINLFSRHNFYVGTSGNLLTGGVFVATAVLPALGSSVPLRLEVPFLPPLFTTSIVEWVRPSTPNGRVPPGVGLSLRHLPDTERSALEKFFQERAPLTYLPNRK